MPSSTFQSRPTPGTKITIYSGYNVSLGKPYQTRVEQSFGSTRQVVRSKSWSNTPGYRHLIAAGQPLPDRTFSYSEDLTVLTSGSIRSPLYPTGVGTESQTVFWQQIPVAGTSVPSLSTQLIEAVKANLIKRFKGEQWSAPVFFAEAKKTCTMVVARATQLANLIHSLRKGRFRDFIRGLHPDAHVEFSKRRGRQFDKDFGKDPVSTAAKTWLEYKYGWVPFMKDVQDAVNALMVVNDRPNATVGRVRAKSVMTETITYRNVVLFSDGNVNFEVRGNLTQSSEQSARAVWRFRTKPADLPGRLGVLNPLTVVWELLPLSFVADWFLPIGDYLSALDVPMLCDHVGGTYGTMRKSTASAVPLSQNQTGYGWSGFDSSKQVRLVISRDLMSGYPAPVLSKSSFQYDIGATKLITSIALLRTQLLRLNIR